MPGENWGSLAGDWLKLSDSREWERWREEQRETLRRRFFEALLDRGRELADQGDAEDALGYLEEAVDLNPYSLAGLVLQVETLLSLGQIPAALQALEEARREVGEMEGASEELTRLKEKLMEVRAHSGSAASGRPGGRIEFVGRASQLAELTKLWKQARNGHTRTACLVGPAGIGKTRLVEEFLALVLREDGCVARAKGFRGEGHLAWGTVADLAPQLMQLPGAKGISSSSDMILQATVPSEMVNGTGVWKKREAAQIGEVVPAALADAMADLVEAVGFEVPLVLFLDDWQWVDKESQSLLRKVVRRMRGLPSMFVVAERHGSEFMDQEDPGCLGKEIPTRRIILGHLAEDELKEILVSWPGLTNPEEVVELAARIYQITEGNPLFVAEVLEKLAEDGLVAQKGSRRILNVDAVPQELSLPASAQALFLEQLDGLSPSAKCVVGALAEEKRSISAGPLRRKAKLDEGVFARSLWELLERRVVVWGAGGELDFPHDRIRATARLVFSAKEPAIRFPKRRLGSGKKILGRSA